MTARLLSMSEAFERYVAVYVPNAHDLDVVQLAQIKGAFAAGLHLGLAIVTLDHDEAVQQVNRWVTDVEEFWRRTE